MGRKALPDNVKQLKGTERKSRVNARKPKIQSTRGAVPPDFLTGVARKEWARVTPELEAIGVLTNLDLAILAAYCTAVSMLHESCEQLEANGPVYECETKDGGVMQRKSPWIEIQNQAIRNVISTASELGITPASRSKVSTVGKEKPDNPWAD